MEKSFEELKQEADELGLTYSPNIGKAKLEEKIEQRYKEIEESSDSVESNTRVSTKGALATRKEALKIIAEQIVENKKTKVVKITMVDKREASTATHAFFSNGDVSLHIPLDVWVEMPNILVQLAEEARAVIHVDSNGITEPKLTKKYVVEYK